LISILIELLHLFFLLFPFLKFHDFILPFSIILSQQVESLKEVKAGIITLLFLLLFFDNPIKLRILELLLLSSSHPCHLFLSLTFFDLFESLLEVLLL